MKVRSTILRYFGLSLTFWALSLLQATQISDKERYLLNQVNLHHDDYKDDEKVSEKNNHHTHYRCLKGAPYAQWANKKIVYSPMLSEKQDQELNLVPHGEDRRKKISNLSWQLKPFKKAVDIPHYIVKIYADFGTCQSQGTGTIINIAKDSVYLLTCAHNVVKSNYNNLYKKPVRLWAQDVTFVYQGNDYQGHFYYVHPSYKINTGTDIAVIVSYSGCKLHFPYNFFPELTSKLKDKNRGWVIGFPGEKKKKGELYGMSGSLKVALNIVTHGSGTNKSQGSFVPGMFDPFYNTIFPKKKDFVIYKYIITSQGQSGSAIWVKRGSMHKIVGVDTSGSHQYQSNYGSLLDYELIKWIKLCYKKTEEINTAFLIAASKGNLVDLRILKNKGANVKAKNQYGNNALHFAALSAPNGKTIEWLIDTAHIPIESKGYYQKTPFLIAAEKGNLNALKLLKKKGANIKATTQYKNNALHLAALSTPNGKGIQWLIDIAHIPIESKGEYEATPFLMAAEKGNLTALKLLKKKGAHLNAKNQNGNNALHYAAMYAPNGKGIQWLIDIAHIPIESKGYYQKTPFLVAAEEGNLNALKILKKKGANPKAKDQDGNNALHYAVLDAPNRKGIEWLIDTVHIPIESKGNKQATPFLMAAEKGNLSALKILKNKGANLDAIDKNGNNALHLATNFAPNGKGIEWLIDIAHIPIESKGYYQKTPFLLAAKKGNLSALRILKKKGAHLNATDQKGKNALHLAALYAPNGKGIQWLIDFAHIPIESRGHYQKTPFLLAAKKGNIAALKILKNKGANLHAIDKDGNNALHLAASFAPNGKGIEWLIDTAHISIESKGYNQATPFLMAAEKENLDALKILKKKGAHLNATDQDGDNALHLAAFFARNGKGIQWLIDFAHIPIESKGSYQKTPFLTAAQNGNLVALKILKHKGANLNASDQDGDNALHLAAFFAPNGKGLQWLMDFAHIPIESNGSYQKTPFLTAAQNGNLVALKILKHKGANLNATDQDGDNALHLTAFFAPNGKGLQWLIDFAHISIESKGSYQKTPFLMAAENGNLDILKILKKKGANLNATDQNGNNAFYYAKKYSNSQATINWLQEVCGLN